MPDAENASTDNADAVDSEDTLGLDNRAWRRLATVLGVHVDPASATSSPSPSWTRWRAGT